MDERTLAQAIESGDIEESEVSGWIGEIAEALEHGVDARTAALRILREQAASVALPTSASRASNSDRSWLPVWLTSCSRAAFSASRASTSPPYAQRS